MYIPRRFTGLSLTGNTTFLVPSGWRVERSPWPRAKHRRWSEGRRRTLQDSVQLGGRKVAPQSEGGTGGKEQPDPEIFGRQNQGS